MIVCAMFFFFVRVSFVMFCAAFVSDILAFCVFCAMFWCVLCCAMFCAFLCGFSVPVSRFVGACLYDVLCVFDVRLHFL